MFSLTAVVVVALISLVLGAMAGIFVGRKNPKIADKAVELSEKLK
jgi:ABC-type dipeptide/oligopeptide/nickel transport system permease component